MQHPLPVMTRVSIGETEVPGRGSSPSGWEWRLRPWCAENPPSKSVGTSEVGDCAIGNQPASEVSDRQQPKRPTTWLEKRILFGEGSEGSGDQPRERGRTGPVWNESVGAETQHLRGRV